MTSDGVLTMTYDAENRLLTASKSGMSATYGYDPMGRRVKSIVNSTTTVFLDSEDEEIADYDGSGSLLRRYITGPGTDQPIAMIGTGSSPTRDYFHVDRMGTTVAMTDNDDHLSQGPFTYDAYGQSSQTGGVPFRFTGRRLDLETGLYYYRARYYSAALGRFLQSDPVGYRDQMHLYAYVSNNPTNAADPRGLYHCEGSKDDCAQIKAYRDKLDTAMGAMDKDSEEYSRAKKIADTIGTEDDGNGLTIEVGPTVNGGPAEAVSENLIRVDVSMVESAAKNGWVIMPPGMSEADANAGYGAGVLAHEGSHVQDMKDGIAITKDAASETASEVKAYTIQRAVEKASGITTGLYWPWQTEGEKNQRIQSAAESSVQSWCKFGGHCK